MSDTYGVNKVKAKTEGKRPGRPKLALSDEAKGQVMAFLKSRTLSSKADVLAGTGLSKSVVTLALKELETNGSIVKSGAKKGTKYRTALSN